MYPNEKNYKKHVIQTSKAFKVCSRNVIENQLIYHSQNRLRNPTRSSNVAEGKDEIGFTCSDSRRRFRQPFYYGHRKCTGNLSKYKEELKIQNLK